MVSTFYFSKLHCFERPYIKTKSHVKKSQASKKYLPIDSATIQVHKSNSAVLKLKFVDFYICK